MSKSATTVKPKIAYGALLGRVIEHHRTLRRVHQEQMASTLRVTQSAYSKLEKGQSSITVVQLNAVAARLKVPSATLLQDTERYAVRLRQQGVEITDEKQDSSAAGLLVALGLLAALIAAAGN
ncbi:MAG TPA: helix-turn-helix transcriptional regulator [Steroidobacteraceae bacterium]|nr:helix-turn-helix transcriptional regulator [Steroidobacteraceae bacterium]